MFTRAIILAAVFAVCFGEEKWQPAEGREIKEARAVTFEGKVQNSSVCQDTAFGISKGSIQFHPNTSICVAFTQNLTVADTTNDNVTMTSTEFDLYILVDDEKKKDDKGITTGGIIATIIMSIAFFICLVTLAIFCKGEHVDIAAQMDALEKIELEKEEAVSEHWERKSQEAEAKELEEVTKDLDEKKVN